MADIVLDIVKCLDLTPSLPIWDGVDDHGRAVPQGVYFLRIDNVDSGDMLCQKVLRIK